MGGGSSQFITILQWGGGVSRDPKFVLRNIWTAPKKIKTQEPCPIESLIISILHIHHQQRSTSVSSNPPLPHFHTAIHHLIVHKNLLDFFLCGTSWAGRELHGVVKNMRPGDKDYRDYVDLYIIGRFCLTRKMITLPNGLKSSSLAVKISFFNIVTRKCSL